jgi:hypothetical protein
MAAAFILLVKSCLRLFAAAANSKNWPQISAYFVVQYKWEFKGLRFQPRHLPLLRVFSHLSQTKGNNIISLRCRIPFLLKKVGPILNVEHDGLVRKKFSEQKTQHSYFATTWLGVLHSLPAAA